jgi:hypothetical protein
VAGEFKVHFGGLLRPFAHDEMALVMSAFGPL